MANFLNRLATAGNMQTYQQQLQAQQQAQAIANALNALKLGDAQNQNVAAGLLGNTWAGGGGAPTPPPGASSPPSSAPPVMGMAPQGGAPTPPPPSAPTMQNVPMPNASLIPPVNASQLQAPPSPQAAGQPPTAPTAPAAPQAGGSAASGQQQPWYIELAMKIKQQAPNATGPQIKAAIDQAASVVNPAMKQEWEMFATRMQAQLREQGLQNQLQIANQRSAVMERGQDINANSRFNSITERNRHDIAEEDIQNQRNEIYNTKSSLDREEKAREADQRSKDTNRSITERVSAQSESIKYKYEALVEKSKEADRRASDTEISIQEREKAHDDSIKYMEQSLQAKREMFSAKLQEDQLKSSSLLNEREREFNQRDTTARRGQDVRAETTQRGQDIVSKARDEALNKKYDPILASNLAQAKAAGNVGGRTNAARADAEKVLSGPAVQKAIKYLPPEQDKLEGWAQNLMANFENSPDYAAFKSANTAAAGEIARALAGGGLPRSGLTKEIETQLNNATDQKAWYAVANSYLTSAGAAGQATSNVVGMGGKDDAGGIQLPAASNNLRTATDAKGIIYTETPDGRWLDPQGKPYAGQ